MKLSVVCLASILLDGEATERVPKGSRWKRKLEWRQNKKQKVISTLARSDVGIPSWTPCESGFVSTEMPKRKLTKVEDCLLTNGIAIDAIKCLNWKYMANHPDLECRDLCLKSLSSYGNMAMVRQRCENGILTSDKKDEDIQRGNGKGKKNKKVKKPPQKPEPSKAPETKPTMLSDSRLLFDDEFDDTTNEINGEEEIIETLVDLEQPLFEDLSEDGSMVLFDDEDFSEDKTDAVARQELVEDEDEVETESSSNQTKAKKSKKKGKKGKKGKKARQG